MSSFKCLIMPQEEANIFHSRSATYKETRHVMKVTDNDDEELVCRMIKEGIKEVDEDSECNVKDNHQVYANGKILSANICESCINNLTRSKIDIHEPQLKHKLHKENIGFFDWGRLNMNLH